MVDWDEVEQSLMEKVLWAKTHRYAVAIGMIVMSIGFLIISFGMNQYIESVHPTTPAPTFTLPHAIDYALNQLELPFVVWVMVFFGMWLTKW